MRAESRLSLLAVAVGSAACAAVAAVGADARWLAALGGAIAHSGIPSSVPYAAAASRDWANVPVLAELLFHWLDVLGGDRALVLAQAAAIALALTLLLRDMRSAGAGDAARALVIVAVPFAVVSAVFVVRAQLFSFPLFALAMLLLRSETRRPSRRIWLLVPLVVLWSNLHGAVLTGLAVATVYLAIERFRHDRWTALGVFVASWVALFATPALLRSGDYYLGVLHSAPASTGFGLWAPLSLRSPLDVLFVVIAAPLLAFAWRARPRSWELISIALLIGATVHVSRNAVWLMLFVAVPAASGLRLRDRTPSRSVLVTCAWIVPAILIVAAFTHAPLQTVAGAPLRAHAVRIAAGRPILADPEDAEQLALDGARVWIANPIDAFGLADQRAYLNWLQGLRTGDALLHEQSFVLVQIGGVPQQRLARDHNFREIARDAVAVLYAR